MEGTEGQELRLLFQVLQSLMLVVAAVELHLLGLPVAVGQAVEEMVQPGLQTVLLQLLIQAVVVAAVVAIRPEAMVVLAALASLSSS